MHPVWMVYLLTWTLEWKAWGNATQCCTCIQFVRHVRLISTLQARVCSHGTRSRKVLWTRCKCQHAYMLTKAMLTCIFYLGLWAPWVGNTWWFWAGKTEMQRCHYRSIPAQRAQTLFLFLASWLLRTFLQLCTILQFWDSVEVVHVSLSHCLMSSILLFPSHSFCCWGVVLVFFCSWLGVNNTRVGCFERVSSHQQDLIIFKVPWLLS